MDDKPVSEAAAKHEDENGSRRVLEEPSFSSSARPGSSRSVVFSEQGRSPNTGKVHEKTPDTAGKKLAASGSDSTSPESRRATPKSRLATVRVPEKRTKLSEKVRQFCIDAHKGVDTSAELEETLANNFKFFREQDKAVRTELCAHVKFHSMRKDEVVCCEGEICDKFYILLSGILACFKNLEAEVNARPRVLPKGSSTSKGVNHSYWRRGAMVVKSHMKHMSNCHVDVEYAGSIRPGEVFGDRSLIRRQPHPSTCVCESDCTFLYIENEMFLKIFEAQYLSVNLGTFDFLKDEVKAFATVHEDDVRTFGQHLAVIEVSEGAAIFLETLQRLYVVRSGTCELLAPAQPDKGGQKVVLRSDEGNQVSMCTRVVGKVGRGSFLCGSAIFPGLPKSSGNWVGRALTRLTLHGMDSSDLRRLSCPGLVDLIYEEAVFKNNYFLGRRGVQDGEDSQVKSQHQSKVHRRSSSWRNSKVRGQTSISGGQTSSEGRPGSSSFRRPSTPEHSTQVPCDAEVVSAIRAAEKNCEELHLPLTMRAKLTSNICQPREMPRNSNMPDITIFADALSHFYEPAEDLSEKAGNMVQRQFVDTLEIPPLINCKSAPRLLTTTSGWMAAPRICGSHSSSAKSPAHAPAQGNASLNAKNLNAKYLPSKAREQASFMRLRWKSPKEGKSRGSRSGGRDHEVETSLQQGTPTPPELFEIVGPCRSEVVKTIEEDLGGYRNEFDDIKTLLSESHKQMMNAFNRSMELRPRPWNSLPAVQHMVNYDYDEAIVPVLRQCPTYNEIRSEMTTKKQMQKANQRWRIKAKFNGVFPVIKNVSDASNAIDLHEH